MFLIADCEKRLKDGPILPSSSDTVVPRTLYTDDIDKVAGMVGKL